MNNEKEIGILNFLIYPLYHWKAILCTCLVLLVLGNLFFLRNSRPADTAEQEAAGSQEVSDEFSSENELKKQEAFLQERVENQQKYLRSSILVGMNPYHVWHAEHNICISANPQIHSSTACQASDQTPGILSAYAILLNSENLTKDIAGKLNLENWQVRELINVSTEESTITIQVIADSQERAQQIMDLIVLERPAIEAKLHESFGAFTADLLLESCYEDIDFSILEKKNQVLSGLEEDQKVLQQSYDNLVSMTASPSDSKVQYSLMFVVLGLLLSYAFFAIQVLTGNRLYSAPCLERYQELVHLGSVLPNKKIGRFGLRLRKLEDRALSSDDDAYALVASNIRNFAGEKKNILIVGDASAETCKTVAEKLSAQLSGMTLSYKGSLLKDAASVSALKDCDGVVLVEQCLVSRCDHIAKELTCIKGAGASIVGCVVVEL